jgi:hypothetical protein
MVTLGGIGSCYASLALYFIAFYPSYKLCDNTVNTLSQFMVEPRRVPWVATKHVLRYLCGTVDYGLDYQRGDGVRLVGYTDSDWAGCVSDRKSTSGCRFGLGSAMVSWFSWK